MNMSPDPVPAPTTKKAAKASAAVPAPAAKRRVGRPAKNDTVKLLEGPGAEAAKKVPAKTPKPKPLLMNLERFAPVPADALTQINQLIHQSGKVAAATQKYLSYVHYHVADSLMEQIQTNKAAGVAKLFEFPANVGNGRSADRVIARSVLLAWVSGTDSAVYIHSEDFDAQRKTVQGLCGLDIRIPFGSAAPVVQLSEEEFARLGDSIAFSAAFPEGGYVPGPKHLDTFKSLEVSGFVVNQDGGYRVTETGRRAHTSHTSDDLAKAQAAFRETVLSGPLASVLKLTDTQQVPPGASTLPVGFQGGFGVTTDGPSIGSANCDDKTNVIVDEAVHIEEETDSHFEN